jgi:adenylate kinase family enzyme
MTALPARVVVIGISGSGKSTMATALARFLDCPHVELDSLYWGPDWTARSEDEFRALARTAVSGAEWVVDGNYRAARDIVWPRAGAVVWLNYSFTTALRRVFVRSLRRMATRQVLWNGNRESFRRTFLSRESILMWVITTYHRRRREYAALKAGGAYAGIEWIELRRPADATRFLRWLHDARRRLDDDTRREQPPKP